MRRRLKLLAIGLACAAFVSACSSSSDDASDTTTTMATATPAASATADTRTKLNVLLGEHLILASKATNAALGGRTEEFSAYGDQLNKNGTDIGAMIGSVYGDEAQTKFNGIWSAHNGFFVDYTTGVAKNDKAAQDKAVSDLTNTYVPQFTDFIVDATGLPSGTVKTLVTEHVTGTKAIVDAQAAKDWTAAVKAENEAYAHMRMIGDPLAGAIAKKFPDKFATDTATKATDLRVSLNQALQAHLYLASSATGAALGGRADEFKAYGDALNTNGTDLGSAIGSVYGAEAQAKFNGIWSAHNGFFVDYTTGVAKNDKAAQDKAVSDLTNTYVPQFTDFIVNATDLPGDTVKSLVAMHVTGTKAVVDAQGAKNVTKAAEADRAEAQHMGMIADPLAAAIAKKNPSKFTG